MLQINFLGCTLGNQFYKKNECPKKFNTAKKKNENNKSLKTNNVITVNNWSHKKSFENR